MTRITCNLHEDKYSFLIISHSVLLRLRNVSVKILKKIETHILHSTTLFENHAFYEIMWQNIVMSGRTTNDNMAHGHFMLDTEV
jgi:hypothetical protein